MINLLNDDILTQILTYFSGFPLYKTQYVEFIL